ncbi:MAG: hypothetical protein AAFX87_13075 [Bacteroidota bacterium]
MLSRYLKIAMLWAGLLASHITLGQTETPANNELADKIHALHDKIIEEGNTLSQLTEEDLASLPVGIARNIGDLQYMIMIDSARFTPRGAFFNAYVSLEMPSSGKRIAFAAENIGFHPGGLASTNLQRLYLVSKQDIDIGKKITLELPVSDKRNFVEWDCGGFKSINLKGIFRFDEEMLVPEGPNGEPVQGKQVEATFETNVQSWDDLIAQVEITPFQVPKLKGFSFSVDDATIDFSDIVNPQNMQFPKDYQSGFEGNMMLWQGFFLREITIKLPQELATNKGRKEITAQNMIIDKMGFSGAVGVKNLFGREEGTLNGWPFSIDSLGVVMVKSQLKGGAFKGQMNVPLFDDDAPVKYAALIFEENNETNYRFSVTPNKTLSASVLSAKVELLPNSTIIITKQDGKLKPEAILNGRISVQDGAKVAVRGLEFQDLHLASEKPYIRNGVWELTGKGDQKVSNFPIAINNLIFQHNQDQLSLTLDVMLNLMNKEDKGFSAETTVKVNGEIEEEIQNNGEFTVTKQKWKHKSTEISDIHIDVKGSSYSLEGTLSLYDEDSTFGSGFRGEINAQFDPGPGMKAIAQFGNVKGLRYWYVDAQFRFKTPKGNGAVGIYGFGGGMYYHMNLEKRQLFEVDDFITKNGENDKFEIGATRSGSRYVPDASIGIGFKASVILGTQPNPHPLNGDVTFEMAFNSGGGVRFIRFRGEAFFMTPIEKRSAKAPMYADLDMLYDFQNRVFHATLDTYINVGGVLRGVGPNGLAGSAVIHFAPDEWYVHVGTPEQRVGLNFIGLVETGAYFMAGTYIHDMPTPPSQVSEILGDMDLDFMRDENAIATGGGIAFGSSMLVNTGRLKFLIFYGQFQAGAGFDIMLRNYGDAHCAGESDRIGINGWYASGQAYAFLMGSIGVHVKLKFIKGEFEILSIGAAAVLQAKLPNPVWMQGVVGGKFSILGGLVSGNCRFKVTIGKECEIVGANSLGIKVIADVKPHAADGEVSVFSAPQAAFNVAIDKEFEYMDSEGELNSYRVKLDEFNVIHNGDLITGELEWNDNHDVAIFNPYQVLPPKANIKTYVKILWEEKIDGVWRPMGGSKEQEIEEEASTFTTGEAPEEIPDENVKYSYPIAKQYHFHQDEHGEGYIQLYSGMDYLFETEIDGKAWEYVARFAPKGQPTFTDVPVTYQGGSSRGAISFGIPQNLSPEKVYDILLVRTPQDARQAVDQNVTASKENVASQGGTTIDLETKNIDEVLTLAKEKVIYTSHFRTSKYKTFTAKLDALSGYNSGAGPIVGLNLWKLGATTFAPEQFDEFELVGDGEEIEALVTLEALTDNPWYRDNIYPMVYQYYPVNSDLDISWRETEPVGIPPLRGMSIYQETPLFKLTEEGAASGEAPGYADQTQFIYDLSFYAYNDYFELRQKAWDKYIDSNAQGIPVGAYRLMSGSYINMLKGQYRFKVGYRLPGINKTTSSKVYTIDF